MSIQAGWNQALFTAGALGKLKQQTDFQEYSQLRSMYGTLREKMDPVKQQGLEAYKAAGQSGAGIFDVMGSHAGENLSPEIKEQLDDYKKSMAEAVQDTEETLLPKHMPRSMRKTYDKAMLEYSKGGFKDKVNAHAEGYAERKAMQAEMAAQRAQDAAQAADMQPKNSMSPIIEQLRRNTQNAVKGGTK